MPQSNSSICNLQYGLGYSATQASEKSGAKCTPRNVSWWPPRVLATGLKMTCWPKTRAQFQVDLRGHSGSTVDEIGPRFKNNMRCSSSSPSWALAGPRLFPLPAPHALLPLRKTRLLLLQPTWLHLPLLPLACPWLPPLLCSFTSASEHRGDRRPGRDA